MRRSLFLLIIACLALTLTCCHSEEDEPTVGVTLYDIVRLDANSLSGTRFSLYEPSNTREVILTASQWLNTKKVEVGDRLLIAYIPNSGKAYTSGAVKLVGYQLIVNAEMATMSMEEIGDWNADPVYLNSAWLSGKYLNINCKLPFDNRARRFGVIADEATLDSECPDLYLVHQLDDEVNTFDRQYYASFDLSALYALPHVNGFTLHLNNSNLRLDAISFTLNPNL